MNVPTRNMGFFSLCDKIWNDPDSVFFSILQKNPDDAIRAVDHQIVCHVLL
jgi:hypothetical protein